MFEAGTSVTLAPLFALSYAMKVSMRFLIALLLCFACIGVAQPPLPPLARKALRLGNSTVVQALLSYPKPFIDQPLWREAINYGLAAKNAAPTNPEPYGYLGKVYSYVNFYDAAWNAYASFRALGGTLDERQRQQLIDLGRTLGYEFFARDNFEKALGYYLIAHSYAPNDQDLNLQIARSYLGNDQADLASAYLRKLEAQAVGDYSRYLETANDQFSYGQSASDAFERAIKQYYLGNLHEARDLFAEASRLDPNFQKAYIWAGRVSLELSQPEVALPYWQNAVVLQPSSADVQYFLTLTQQQLAWGLPAYHAFEQGMAFYGKGNMTEAKASLGEAVAHNPTISEAWAWLGRIAFESADYQTAYHAFGTANRLAESNETYRYFYEASARQLDLQLIATQPSVTPDNPVTLEQVAPMIQAKTLESITESSSSEDTNSNDTSGKASPNNPIPENPAPENPAPENPNAENFVAENLVTKRSSAERSNAEPSSAETLFPNNPFARSSAPNNLVPESSVTKSPSVQGTTAKNASTENPRIQNDAVLSSTLSDDNFPVVTAPEVTPTNGEAISDSSLIEADLVSTPSGDPLVLLSTFYTFERPDIVDRGAVSFFAVTPDLHQNWQTPINYAGGVVYQRLEVSRKPSLEPITYQLCLVPNDDISIKPACSRAQGLEFHDIGVYEFQQPLSNFYQYDSINWSRGISNLIVILRDENGNPLDPRSSPEQRLDLNLYYPIEVRYSVVLVPEGGTFRGWP
jgi:tetratricopeptide (TPR) repeat protein